MKDLSNIITNRTVRNLIIVPMALALTLPFLTGCDDNDEYTEMPGKIQSFVSEYFPETSVSDYSFSNNIYHVTLSGSAYLEFNAVPAWIKIDGRGSVLPEMLLYDQLPSTLYTYIETLEATEGIYSIARNKEAITASLLDSTITYDIATGKINGPE
ncbi:MAG: hypothetical protein HDS68_01580 [Bacteroidales bacterium]|nr:hypothetical protein [Bacteroidales bacterium]